MRAILKYVFLGLCLSIVSCSDSDPQGGLHGTSDGGGGEIVFSTEQDIRDALPKAIEIISRPMVFDAMARTGFDVSMLSDQESYELTRIKFFLRSPGTAWILDLTKDPEMQAPLADKDPELYTEDDWAVIEIYLENYSKKMSLYEEKYKYETLSEYIQLSPIFFKESGPCPALDKTNAFASVSKFDIGADICLSLEKLKMISKADLLRQMTALLAHEVAHLFGANEVTAIKIQELTLNGFSHIVESSASFVPYNMYKVLLRASSHMDHLLISWNKPMTDEDLQLLENATPEQKPAVLQKIQSRKILFLLARVGGYLDSFTLMFDEQSIALPVFYLEETEKKEKLLLEEINTLTKFISDSYQFSDEFLTSDEYFAKLQEQQVKMDFILKSYSEIMDYY